jgi:hypothetical protein
MSNYPRYNVNNEHQLIRRQNTYVLDRKLVTIHSEDRDYNKWPNSNSFEVTLPSDITNIQSMRLVDIQLPCNQYVFSNYQQNTKFNFYLFPRPSTEIGGDVYTALLDNSSNVYELTIQEGFYTPCELANELEGLMNSVVTSYIQQTAIIGLSSYEYTKFKVYYDNVGQQMYFGNTYDGFSFPCQIKIEYNVKCKSFQLNQPSSVGCNYTNGGSAIQQEKPQYDVFCRYTKWGLPSYLGFEKDRYDSIDTSGNIEFYYNKFVWLIPDTTIYPLSSPIPNLASYIVAPNTVNIFGESAIYMEVEKYNTIDEIKPYSLSTNNLYNNDYNGRANSAFAKIPLTASPASQVFDSRNGFLQNVSQYHPPIDKIRKLKFTFRYHDERLVDFKSANFNFTIAFNQLRDEIARDYIIRVPDEYRL